MTTREHEVYVRAISKWGREAQMRQLMEECGELIAATNRHMRGRCRKYDVLGEIADVAVMLDQMRMMIGATEDDFDSMKRAKLLGLEERMDLDASGVGR